MRDKRDVIPEGAKFLDTGVPGDRLDLAVGSPVQRTREQDDQAPAMGEGLEVLILVLMIDRFKIMRNFCADRGAGFQRVVFRRCVSGLRHGGGEDRQADSDSQKNTRTCEHDFSFRR